MSSIAAPTTMRRPCPVAATLEVLGPKSAFLVLREASFGTRRFGDFVSRTGLSEPVTSGRLRSLVSAGLLERRTYREPGQRARDEYALTEKGLAMVPVLVALREWGERYALGDAVGSIRLEHRGCGAPVQIEIRCGAGHRVLAGEAAMMPAGAV